ncbi:MAG: hypothetical protein JWQ87_2238 [Candidatus Sulfotelmatobacter sp.]|nr:hypothetical protein [Candidatus Sulfotelmatobacter sp.]
MPEKSEQSEADFIATARKRFEQAEDDEKLLRQEAAKDLDFVAGDQWDPKQKQDREAAGRPAMVFNRMHTFVQQVSNEARQNKPQIKFAPGDDSADKDTAEVLEGMARAIQNASDAQVAYETSVEYSAGGSFGYFRFLTEENEDGDQELKIVPVLDPFAVYGILFPACFNREPKFGFVIEDMPKEEFEAMYPDSPISKGDIGDSGWMTQHGWLGTDMVRIAEYWYCEEGEKKGGKQIYKVKFCKISGMEVLPDTKTDWLDDCIPILPVLGKGMIRKGRPELYSVVRFQRSAQQMINYGKSRIAETLATSPISPFIVAKGQIPKGDKKWETLNSKVYPYLEYEQMDIQGKPAPPPQRQTFEPPIQSLSGFVAQEIDDMKATAGIFDASLGQKSNETSGTAIARRQQQSNMTTMHYMDNLERAFKKGGGIMRRLIRIIYDTDRMVQILGEDQAPKIVRINALHTPPGGKSAKHYKVGGSDAGKYHEIVTMGRAFSTKRMESFDMMSEVTQGNPQLMPMIGDIMFRNSDVAGADQLADRFHKMLPPNLQDNDENDPAKQAQALQGQLMQAKQHLQLLNAYAQKLEKEKEGKVIETQGRAQIAQFQEESKRAIALMQEETKRYVAEVSTKAQDVRERLKLGADLDKQMHVSAHEAATQAVDHTHERGQAQQAAQQAQQAQASDQVHESGMADKNAAISAESQASDQQHQQTMAEQSQSETGQQ